MPSQVLVVIDSLDAGDPESEEIIRSLNVELEPHKLKAGPWNYAGSWMVSFPSEEGEEARAFICSKLEAVHPDPWDHVRVLEP